MLECVTSHPPGGGTATGFDKGDSFATCKSRCEIGRDARPLPHLSRTEYRTIEIHVTAHERHCRTAGPHGGGNASIRGPLLGGVSVPGTVVYNNV